MINLLPCAIKFDVVTFSACGSAQTSAKRFTMSSMVEKKFTAAQTKLDAMLAKMDEKLSE